MTRSWPLGSDGRPGESSFRSIFARCERSHSESEGSRNKRTTTTTTRRLVLRASSRRMIASGPLRRGVHLLWGPLR